MFWISKAKSATIDAPELNKGLIQDASIAPDANPTSSGSIETTSEAEMENEDIPVGISSAALASLGGKWVLRKEMFKWINYK